MLTVQAYHLGVESNPWTIYLDFSLIWSQWLFNVSSWGMRHGVFFQIEIIKNNFMYRLENAKVMANYVSVSPSFTFLKAKFMPKMLIRKVQHLEAHGHLIRLSKIVLFRPQFATYLCLWIEMWFSIWDFLKVQFGNSLPLCRSIQRFQRFVRKPAKVQCFPTANTKKTTTKKQSHYFDQ